MNPFTRVETKGTSSWDSASVNPLLYVLSSVASFAIRIPSLFLLAPLLIATDALQADDEPKLLLVSQWTNDRGASVTLRQDETETFLESNPGFRDPQPLFYVYDQKPNHDQEIAVPCVRWRYPNEVYGDADWVFETETNAPDDWWTRRGYDSKTIMGWVFTNEPKVSPTNHVPISVNRISDPEGCWRTTTSVYAAEEFVCWAITKKAFPKALSEESETPQRGAEPPETARAPLAPLPLGNFQALISERTPLDPSQIGPIHESRSTIELQMIDPVWISPFEVSTELYHAVMENPEAIPQALDAWGPRQAPVSRISGDDAVSFCQELTRWFRQGGRIPESYHFRLPRREEFSLAITAGTPPAYRRSGTLGTPSPFMRNATDMERLAVTWRDASRRPDTRTFPIGEKEPNAIGAWDLLGNLEEIVTNADGDVFYRGGASWIHGPEELSWAAPFRRITNTYRSPELGFRFVLAPKDDETGNQSSTPRERYWIRDDYRVVEWKSPTEGSFPPLIDLHVTRNGALWMAANGSVFRLHGEKLDIFHAGDLQGLPHHIVTAITSDHQGGVWLLNERIRHITRYHNGRFDTAPLPNEAKSVDDLSLAHDGASVWLRALDDATNDSGRLYQIRPTLNPENPFQFRDVPFNSLGTAPLTTARETDAHTLLASTTRENLWITSLDPDHAPKVQNQDSAPLKFITSDSEGRFAARQNNAILLGKGTNLTSRIEIPQPFTVRAPSIGHLLPDGSPVLQIANALLHYKDDAWWALPFLEGRRGLELMDVDRDGGLWIGVAASPLSASDFSQENLDIERERQGLWRLSLPKILNLDQRSGITAGQGWSACPDGEGGVWLMTNGGVTRWTKDGAILPYRGPRSWLITGRGFNCVYSDSENRLWIGMRGYGYQVMDPARDTPVVDSPILILENQRWTPIDVGVTRNQARWINVIHQDREGVMWFGAQKGLIRYAGPEDSSFLTTADGLPDNDIRIVHEDQNGRLWIGTYGNGLAQFDRDQNTFLHLTQEDGLSGNVIISVLEDADGALWFGTENGVTHIDENGVTSIGAENGFPGPNVNQFFQDRRGDYWTGGETGIFRITQEAMRHFLQGAAETIQYEAFSAVDGLPSVDTNGEMWPAGCVTDAGDLVFPTPAGFSIVRPDNFREPQPRARAFLRDMLLHHDDGVLNAVEAITLRSLTSNDSPLKITPNRAASIEFTYGATELDAPNALQFRYRLTGLSDQWRDVGAKRSVVFASLQPGDYAFQVVARDHNHLWGEPTPPFAFTVQPHLHQTAWFPGVASGVLIALGILTHGVTTRSKRRREDLERKLAFNKQRERLTRDIHDELGNDLALIKHKLRHLRASLSPPLASHATPTIEALNRAADDGASALRRILWSTDPEKDTLEQTISHLIASLENGFKGTQTRFLVDAPIRVPEITLTPLARHNLLMILREAQTNILKHANATRAWLTILYMPIDKTLTMTIRDNGVGAPPNPQNGYGLQIMQERAKEIGATWTAENTSEGFQIDLILKL